MKRFCVLAIVVATMLASDVATCKAGGFFARRRAVVVRAPVRRAVVVRAPVRRQVVVRAPFVSVGVGRSFAVQRRVFVPRRNVVFFRQRQQFVPASQFAPSHGFGAVQFQAVGGGCYGGF